MSSYSSGGVYERAHRSPPLWDICWMAIRFQHHCWFASEGAAVMQRCDRQAAVLQSNVNVHTVCDGGAFPYRSTVIQHPCNQCGGFHCIRQEILIFEPEVYGIVCIIRCSCYLVHPLYMQQCCKNEYKRERWEKFSFFPPEKLAITQRYCVSLEKHLLEKHISLQEAKRLSVSGAVCLMPKKYSTL